MPNEAKILRLSDMIFNRQGTFVRRLIHAVISLALRLFFRRIETEDASAVPYKDALIFVMNHPNGLIDPALVFVALPRKISFLAKSTLFKMPVVSYVLKVVEALPVYRKIDSADVTKNRLTFEACNDLLRKEGAIALFPEGVSHDSTKLLPIKTGAARIALGAISGFSKDESVKLKIVPVGLYYTNKTTFRSEALLHFGKAFEVNPVELESDGDLPREAVRELSNEIEEALREVTVNAESRAELEVANEAANLFLSVSETFDLEESLAARSEFIREYLAEKDNNDEAGLDLEAVTGRISEYKKKLRQIGLEPENLSLSSQPFWYVFQHFLVRVWLLLLVSPLAIVGVIIHFPAYQLIKVIGDRYTKHGVDDIVSTVKISAGIVFMPLTWIVIAALIYYFVDLQAALISLPLSFLCGYAALRTLEELYDMRGWFKAVWLFFRKRDLFVDLLLERRALYRSLRKEGS
ncbi:MAG: 1-acyl-sn-glycerol-3-phosphate acyltransferase [Acidobacteria bacterium]|nr:1-acyl-sn-glycerol-3-phosphate acyltransferase [Acidobacteriota bacterium]